MTTRLTIVVALLLVLLAQAWNLVTDWQEDQLRGLAVTRKNEAKTQDTSLLTAKLRLQPTPTGIPPDLNQGFIFNAERSLVPGGVKDGQSQNAGSGGIDKIRYNGSIIVANNTKALLSYSSAGGSAPSPSPGGNSAAQQKQTFLRVAVGDTVDGYTVTEILPGKITFSRGEQQVTKILYDKLKERQQPQPSPPVREPSVSIPAPSPAPSQPPRQDGPQNFPPPRPFQPPPNPEALRNTPGLPIDPMAPPVNNLRHLRI